MKYALLLTTAFALTACTSGQVFESWEEEGESANISAEELASYKGSVYKVEKPYEINGVWYFPAENYNYVEQGLASWYAPANGKTAKTANGEEYIATEMTARHKTLPLPSIVKITNMENGKSIIARVNDRGPMVNNRLIDVSQKAAQELGFPVAGTTQVKVEVLANESRAVRDALVSAGRVYTEQQTEQNDLALVPPMPVPNNPEPLYAPVAATPVAQEPVYTRRTVTSPTPATPMGTIYVQLGAYGDTANASRAARSAGTVGQAITKTKMQGGRTLSVVQAGPFATRAEAEQAVRQLKQMGYRDAFILK